MSERNILISGCSGGGKSSLLDALARLGFATVPEPGRRIVTDELSGVGNALPWVDLSAFAQRAIKLAKSDLLSAKVADGFVFFDRGLIDAAVALAFAGGPPLATTIGNARQYARQVFLAPPWPEIYVSDAARPHGFDEAVSEYERLVGAFAKLGYDVCELPKTPVGERVEFILEKLNLA